MLQYLNIFTSKDFMINTYVLDVLTLTNSRTTSFTQLDMATTDTQNCAPAFCGTCDFMNPDPDIAGIGVILSFIIIGGAIMSLVTIQIFINLRHTKPCEFFFPDIEPLTEDGRWPGVEDARKFLLKAESEHGDNDKSDPKLLARAALASTLFGLADTQFATGIAICLAAFVKRDISCYHYLICNETAWLALICSPAGFLTARTVLDSANIVKKVLRAVLMWCLFGLVAALEFRRNDSIGYAEQVFAAGPFLDMSSDNAKFSLVLFVGTVIGMVIDTVSLVPEWGVLMYYYVETIIVCSSPPFETAVVSFLTRRCQRCAQEMSISSTTVHFAIHLIGLVLVLLIWLPLWVFSLVLYWHFYQPITAHTVNWVFFYGPSCRRSIGG